VHRFPIYNYETFEELPLADFQVEGVSIFVVNKDWKYLFANNFMLYLHKLNENELIGTSLWETLPSDLRATTKFQSFIEVIKSGSPSHVVLTAESNYPSVSIVGFPLQDCYYFAVSILPDKEGLLNEFKTELEDVNHQCNN
jgi:hypothetical protein